LEYGYYHPLYEREKSHLTLLKQRQEITPQPIIIGVNKTGALHINVPPFNIEIETIQRCLNLTNKYISIFC